MKCREQTLSQKKVEYFSSLQSEELILSSTKHNTVAQYCLELATEIGLNFTYVL